MLLADAITKARNKAIQSYRGTPDLSLEDYVNQTVVWQLHSWQQIVCKRLERLTNETGARIVMHGPPQFGKSVITSQRLPAYVLGKNPLARVGLACYNITHATTFGETIKGLMQQPEYRELFPDTVIPKVCGSDAFRTEQRIQLRDGTYSFVAMGLQTGFVGKGFSAGDLLIVDDPYASPEDAISEAINEKTWRWWTQTAKVRIDPLANVVVFFNRYNENDFAGRLLAEGGWEYYRFPAIADGPDGDPTGREIGDILSPIRTREYLEDIKDKDPQTFLGQFQGRPRPPEGAFLKREWLVSETTPPRFKRVCRFWDLAASSKQSNDFYAGALVGVAEDHTVWLLDMCRIRGSWPEICQTIATISEDDLKRFHDIGTEYCAGVEKVAWMSHAIQDLFKLGIFGKVQLWDIQPDRDKKTRASGWAARAAHDKFRMVIDTRWNQDFINEAIAFDGLGLVHDDQCDAVSGAYSLLWTLAGEVKPVKTADEIRQEFYQQHYGFNEPEYEEDDDSN
jgi:predicted phage terminase large subunit-like protein